MKQLYEKYLEMYGNQYSYSYTKQHSDKDGKHTYHVASNTLYQFGGRFSSLVAS